MLNNRCYIYRHIRIDTNEVFYIGMGTTEVKLMGTFSKNKYKRAYSKDNRNIWWNNIVSKTEFRSEILISNLTREDAVELEIFLILEYGRKDLKLGTLVNLTNGGEGKLNGNPFGKNHWNYGRKHSYETKLKIGNSHKGSKISEETRLKLEKAHVGRLYSEHSQETRNKISKSHIGLQSGGKNPSAKIMLNLETGIYYETAKEASESLNLNYSTFMDRLNNRSKKKINLKYV